MIKKYICIHAHFYQPPRENPWLDRIQQQVSASPFHNWNERISSECYRENGRSRIINIRNFVEGFSNNYSKINFNFGPTLLSWLELNDPRTYEYIINGDRISVKQFNGHGNAIAQCYNHMIMPLANKHDKETQVIWGIKDFEKRFNRYPEGMWLPETAVDFGTLEILSEHKIKYIILAPRQASKICKLNSSHWIDVTFEKINTHIPYLIKLPSGAKITAFFYDGGLSKSVAFDGILHNGDYFAYRMLSAFTAKEEGPQLVNMATDGESYGHHHKFGDMALAFALKKIEEQSDVQLCNYGYFLSMHRPEYEVQLFENSSWSCVHGIERWKSNCGCNSGGKLEWNQKWRGPLRRVLDDLRDEINLKYEIEMASFDVDPWSVRNDFINVILNRNDESNTIFLNKWIPEIKNSKRQVIFLKSLELQRQLQFMYTSCAWFFDELSGIETVQVLQYALRAVELAEDIWGNFLLDKFKNNLKSIPSNIHHYSNGLGIYEKLLKNTQIGFFNIAAQYAIGRLFDDQYLMSNIYSFDVENTSLERIKFGNNKLVFGHAELRSRITYSKKHIIFSAVHLGENIISAGVDYFTNMEEFTKSQKSLMSKIEENDFLKILQEMENIFKKNIYTLNDLQAEDRYFLIKNILNEEMKLIDNKFQQIFNEKYILADFLISVGLRIPAPLKISLEHIVNERIIQIFKENLEVLDTLQLEHDLHDAQKGHLHLKENDMRNVFNTRLISFAEGIVLGNYDQHILNNFLFAINFANKILPDIHLSEVQYIIYRWRAGLMSIPHEYHQITENILYALSIESNGTEHNKYHH